MVTDRHYFPNKIWTYSERAGRLHEQLACCQLWETTNSPCTNWLQIDSRSKARARTEVKEISLFLLLIYLQFNRSFQHLYN